MKKYTITIIEQLYYDIEVEAGDESEATEKAWEEFRECHINPSYTDVSIIEVRN